MKNKILATIDVCREDIIAIGEDILRHPELGYKEFYTADVVKREFEKLGLDFRCELAVTGVKATVKIDDTPINVCVIGEMDAVKCYENPFADKITGAAHACGHFAQIAATIGAAMGLKYSGVANMLDGDMEFWATPAEEAGEVEWRKSLIDEGKISFLGGKQEMIKLGHLDHVDAALMIHSTSGDKCAVATTSNGFVAKYIKYTGK